MNNVLLTKRIRILIGLLSLSCFLTGCKFGRDVNRENTSALENQDRDWLLGKTLNSIDSIIHRESEYTILYIFNYYDCNTCINVGFQIVNRIDSLCSGSCVKVVTSLLSDLASIQRINNYRGYVYVDAKDVIRKELKYSPTPMLLLIDLDNRIVDALIPTNNPNNYQSNMFLDSCVKYIE